MSHDLRPNSWTKVFRVFLLAIQRSPLLTRFTPPPPLRKWLETGMQCKHCIRKPQVWALSRWCPETSTKLCVHEFGFWTPSKKIPTPHYTESIATLPPFSPIEGQKWFDQISSQWESQKNRFAFISFGKSRFKPPAIWDQLFMTTVSDCTQPLSNTQGNALFTTFVEAV